MSHEFYNENRGGRIRTSGLSHPKRTRYQAAPHPEKRKIVAQTIYHKKFSVKMVGRVNPSVANHVYQSKEQMNRTRDLPLQHYLLS
jgi:hypothetical protein